VVVLGNGGYLTLTFEPAISDGEGPDFAVFENSFSDTFLELAFVEVSSDGETFVRFDSAYTGQTPLDAFGTQEPTGFYGLAGRYRGGFGTPFDLQTLRMRPEARDGRLDVQNIRWVRIVDVVGDGSARDSFGHPIYDPTPTVRTGGFDLEGVGVLNR
jgi:hypothetical protein